MGTMAVSVIEIPVTPTVYPEADGLEGAPIEPAEVETEGCEY